MQKAEPSKTGTTPARDVANISTLRGYLYLAFTGFVFLQAGLYASRASTELATGAWLLDAATAHLPFGARRDDEHPITHLMEAAEAEYRQKLERQSTTLPAAVAEYRRRYGRAPPRGFDRWWEFAKQNNVLLVDEFDGIEQDLKPFWNMSGAEFRRRTAEVRLGCSMVKS
jgi:hypothetical protein